MPSLIRELQRAALDRNIRVSDLLRQALVVAHRLGAQEVEQWVLIELNGYDDPQAIPTYRVVEWVLRSIVTAQTG
jgi:hypothetical protein